MARDGTAQAAGGQRPSRSTKSRALPLHSMPHTSLIPTNAKCIYQHFPVWNSNPPPHHRSPSIESPSTNRPHTRQSAGERTKVIVYRHPRPPRNPPPPPLPSRALPRRRRRPLSRRRRQREDFACAASTSSRACGASPESRTTCGKAANRNNHDGARNGEA